MGDRVRPLTEQDLGEAQRIVRHAFGTFLGAPDLENFWTDFDYVYGRFGAEHTAAFAQDFDGALAGVNFATRWGSVAFFGPLSVRPDLWDRGLAQPLVKAASDAFDAWGVSHSGLCTFPHSAKHVGLYQKFGFHPRFLTPVMAAPATPSAALGPMCARYSELAAGERADAERECRALSDEIYEGLDLTGEIRTVAARGLGDTLLLREAGNRLAGFAICHWGPASEAGKDCLFVKFGAARSGSGGEGRFAALLEGAKALAGSVGMASVVAGVNTGREQAYRLMIKQGFRTRMHVVIMQRPNEPGYSRPDCFVLDDWR
jgi:GNAT superfamily N-acetyltransferase